SSWRSRRGSSADGGVQCPEDHGNGSRQRAVRPEVATKSPLIVVDPIVNCRSISATIPARRIIPMRFTYAINFVANMDRAVAFYRDTLNLPLKFASPEWSEFDTGETTLALHLASAANPAGTVQLGFSVRDLQQFYQDKSRIGVQFTMPPTKQDFG